MRGRESIISVRAALLCAICGLWLGASGCAVKLPPNAVPGGAIPLAFGRSHPGQLNCPRKDCIHWYRARTDEKGTLQVTVTTDGGKSQSAPFALLLADASADPMSKERSEGRKRVSMSQSLPQAAYLVAISSPEPGELFAYDVRVDFEPAPPPPPPPPPPPEPPRPQFRTHSSPVLEAEGWGQDVQAVFIESGQRQGMRRGIRGKLIDGGKEIGDVVVEKVFPDGSRLKVEGALQSPITPNTRVRLQIPLGSDGQQ